MPRCQLMLQRRRLVRTITAIGLAVQEYSCACIGTANPSANDRVMPSQHMLRWHVWTGACTTAGNLGESLTFAAANNATVWK